MTKTQLNKQVIEAVSDRGLANEAVKAVIEALFGVIAEELLTPGAVVPLGAVGRLKLAEKKARPARLGRNPATGESVQIAAKAASVAVKFSVARSFKEQAEEANKPKKSKKAAPAPAPAAKAAKAAPAPAPAKKAPPVPSKKK